MVLERCPIDVGMAGAAERPFIVQLEESELQSLAPDLLQPTPVDKSPRVLNRFDTMHLALASVLGTPISDPDVRGGAVVQDIYPTNKNRLEADSSYGSEAVFTFHNDQSYLPEGRVPDYVTLACVRNLEGAATRVADVNSIVERLADEDIAELSKEQYVFKHTYHKGTEAERDGNKQSAVLLANGQIRLGVAMESLTEPADKALDRLRRAVGEVAVDYVLSPGEVLVLPNKRTVHGRESFTMQGSAAERRWLTRINWLSGSRK